MDGENEEVRIKDLTETALDSDFIPENYLVLDGPSTKKIRSTDVAQSKDLSVGLSDVFSTYTDTPCFSNSLVRAGFKYRVKVKCEEITVDDDPRIGLYLYLESNVVSQIAHFSPEDLMDGVCIEFSPSSNGDVRVRTLESGVSYEISVSRILPITEMLSIAHVGGGIIKESVTTDSDTPVETDIILKKDINYICSVKADDSWASSSVDQRIGAYLYYYDGTYSQILSTNAVSMKTGISFSVTPQKDGVLRPRTMEAGINVDITVVCDEEKVENVIDEILRKIENSSSNWFGKTWTAYGDSITAISNGDGLNLGWAKYVNDNLFFAGFHGRGIGGSSFEYKLGGGTVAFINAATGNYVSRDGDGHTKDDYSGVIPDGCVASRSSFCSWDRITNMYPQNIKDSIDLIFVMGGTNDSVDNVDAQFVPNDTTDPEWALSSYYSTYGGDYNIGTFKGGIASTIMKLNAWMPQALIVVGTPLSGYGPTGQISTSVDLPEYAKSKDVLEMASRCSCPCVDVFATDGIMPFNRNLYITDQVHPYNADGQKMLARAVIAGLRNVLPHL